MHAATVGLKVDSADTIIKARAAVESVVAQARRKVAFDPCLEMDESGRKARHQLAGKRLRV